MPIIIWKFKKKLIERANGTIREFIEEVKDYNYQCFILNEKKNTTETIEIYQLIYRSRS